MKIERLITNICSDHLSQSRDFYVTLFDMEVGYDSDWFVNLLSKDKRFEIGIIRRTHEIVPADYQSNPQGFYLTFTVEDVDKLHQVILEKGFPLLEGPHDTFYGQRRMLVKDPDGTLVDISSPIKGFSFSS